jgi:hypothetical protein
MSAVIPAARLARKRQVRDEQWRRKFFQVCARVPPERRPEFIDMVHAIATLATAQNAAEFARAKKRVLVLVAKNLSEAQRARILQEIADWHPPDPDRVAVVPVVS